MVLSHYTPFGCVKTRRLYNPIALDVLRHKILNLSSNDQTSDDLSIIECRSEAQFLIHLKQENLNYFHLFLIKCQSTCYYTDDPPMS